MNNELKHYGIHGQKWGRRRWQNEDGSFNEEGKIRYGRIGGRRALYNQIITDRRDLIEHYSNIDPRRKKADELWEDSMNLAKKYHLDVDDGGGGDGSPESIKAGKKYLDLQYKYTELDERIESDAKKAAYADILKKYGQEAVDGCRRAENRTAGLALVAAALMTGGMLYLGDKAVKGAAKIGFKAITGSVKLVYKGIKRFYNHIK